jgi:hypothetical protein
VTLGRRSFGRVALIVATASMFVPVGAASQEPTLEFGNVAVFHCAVLNEDRRLNVFLPAGCSTTT